MKRELTSDNLKAVVLGGAILGGGLQAAAHKLNGNIAASGTVRRYVCEQRDGLDVGFVELDDAAWTTLGERILRKLQRPVP